MATCTANPVNKSFVLAGDATFTVEVPAGGSAPHYTYRVQHVPASLRWDETWFAKMLTGSDNTSDYSYVGKLDGGTGQVALTAKSRLTPESYAFRLLNRVLARVWSDDLAVVEAAGFSVHHEGRCGRCGYLLGSPGHEVTCGTTA